jgi:hypothetical protein
VNGPGKNKIIGGVIALLGASLLLKLLGVDFPIIRVALAIAFIYVGVRLAKGTGTLRMGQASFGKSEFRLIGEISEKESFGVALGTAVLDLSEAQPPQAGNAEVEFGVLLGGATVYYSPKSALEISVQSILGDAHLPDGNSVFAGTLKYRTPAAATAERLIRLNLTVCCGNVQFLAGQTPTSPEPSKPGTS